MAINGVSLNNDISNITSTKVSTTDNGSKNIQNQIANKQQSLNRLASDSKLSAKEKEKKRQEIQKQIDELNRKLELMRMKQEEEAKEVQKKQEQKAVLNEELQTSTVSKEQGKEDSSVKAEDKEGRLELPVSNIQQFLTGDALIQKNRIQNKVISQKEHTENVLESEIKMDELYGNDNTFKTAELDSLKDKPSFEIEALNPPKNRGASGMAMHSNAKVIVVE